MTKICNNCIHCIKSGSIENGLIRIKSRRCKARALIIISQRVELQDCDKFKEALRESVICEIDGGKNEERKISKNKEG